MKSDRIVDNKWEIIEVKEGFHLTIKFLLKNSGRGDTYWVNVHWKTYPTFEKANRVRIKFYETHGI